MHRLPPLSLAPANALLLPLSGARSLTCRGWRSRCNGEEGAGIGMGRNMEATERQQRHAILLFFAQLLFCPHDSLCRGVCCCLGILGRYNSVRCLNLPRFLAALTQSPSAFTSLFLAAALAIRRRPTPPSSLRAVHPEQLAALFNGPLASHGSRSL